MADDRFKDDAATQEWLFKQRIRELAKAQVHPSASNDTEARLDYALKILAAGSDELLKSLDKISDRDERYTAFEGADWLVEAALLIGSSDQGIVARLEHTRRALQVKAEADKAREALELSFLCKFLGHRDVEKPDKELEEIFGSPGEQAKLNALAVAAGLVEFSQSRLRRRLVALRNAGFHTVSVKGNELST